MENASKTLASLGLLSVKDSFADQCVTGISVDSRNIRSGFLFVALSGVVVHGAHFAKRAIEDGAIAILTDHQGAGIINDMMNCDHIAIIVCDNPRMRLAQVAARFYRVQPAYIVAITGTNGKTSIANFTRQIWEHLGIRAVNFGTSGIEGSYCAPLTHTTPEPISLHALLADLQGQGITHVAMEASSHGLDQHRLDGVYLTAAAFTNFTQDHLDYHDNLDAYFNAKSGLFSRVLPPEGSAVINMNDPRGDELLQIAHARGQDVITVGGVGCDLALRDIQLDANGQRVLFSWHEEIKSVRLDLIGAFQALNVLQAAALAIACGTQPDVVFDVLAQLETVSGRMQRVATRKNGAIVYVDYAHTPDAIETALKSIRPHVMGRIIAVIGAGGDRDKDKRPKMGKAAARYGDVVYITDDNPRTEDPAFIRASIMAGCPGAIEIADRAEAILTAIDSLCAGDVLLILGKGHETGQIIGEDILPFDDREQASVAVATLDALDI